jgi:AbiJ N-terminal domain 3
VAQSFSTLPDPAPGQSREISPVTRRDIFDYLQTEPEPWWGRLDEIGFLGQLYDLDALPSTDSRHTTAAQDILRHRVANLDWDDDWVFGDPRFQLADGPDQVLLDFLACMAHPLVRPDTGQAARLVTALNAILAPDGWELRTSGFISGRPVYAACRTVSGPGRMIRLEVEDDDDGKLDIVLGQAHHLLGENGDDHAQRLIAGTALTLRRDGGYFHPIPGDNWTDATYEAVLTADPRLGPEFTTEVTGRIWEALRAVLTHHGRGDVQSLVIEQAAPPLPAVAADWRDQAAQASRQAPGNQARRERAEGGYPACDGLVFGSQAELAVYEALVDIQRDSKPQNSFAVLPLPGAKLRDTAVRTPDLVVIGNGRAAIIEVDGPRHYARTRKADDQDRDRHWDRCGVHTIRIPSERASDPASLRVLLREDLRRRLWPS